MDWEFVAHHLVSGAVPAAAALALYFFIMHGTGNRPTAGHMAASSLFCFYLLGILAVTGICLRASFSPRIAFIPFLDMISGPVDTALNILLFIPMGFFLPVLYEKYDRIGKIALIGLLVSLSVELLQLFGFGTTDINDLITNTTGACVGFGIFKALTWVIPGSWRERIRAEGAQCYFELPILWIGSIAIMLTIQRVIFHALSR